MRLMVLFVFILEILMVKHLEVEIVIKEFKCISQKVEMKKKEQ